MYIVPRLIVCGLAILALVSLAESAGFNNLGTFGRLNYPYSKYFGGSGFPYGSTYSSIGPRRRGGYYPNGCPICDSSVFSYCSHKLVHDSCCCGDSYYVENSFECQYTDCSYLHANSCQESDLILNCCCDDPYKSFNPQYNRFFKK